MTPLTRVGLLIVAGTIAAAALLPPLLPWDPAGQELAQRLEGPSLRHLFGLDELGRDILARVLAGARVSLAVAFIVVSVSGGIGLLVGSIAGYFGGAVDQVVRGVMDVLLAFPGILLAIAMVAALGPSLTNVVLALTLIGWVGYARLVRGQVLRVRELEYVTAAKASGADAFHIIVRHIVPATIAPLLVQATLGMAAAMLAEASLSFLGLGVQPPTPSWGTMINGGRGHLLDAPHLTMFPGACLAAVVLGFNFLGDGLREFALGGNRSERRLDLSG
jgi:peptide/nickel transport system permease protein